MDRGAGVEFSARDCWLNYEYYLNNLQKWITNLISPNIEPHFLHLLQVILLPIRFDLPGIKQQADGFHFLFFGAHIDSGYECADIRS